MTCAMKKYSKIKENWKYIGKVILVGISYDIGGIGTIGSNKKTPL